MMRQTAPNIVQKRTLIGKRSMYYANPSDSEDLTKMRAPILPPVKLCGFGANIPPAKANGFQDSVVSVVL